VHYLLLGQQQGWRPELSQQQESVFLDQLLQPFRTMRNMLSLWGNFVGAVPLLVPNAVKLMLPLVLQLQQCCTLLAGCISAGSSNSCSSAAPCWRDASVLAVATAAAVQHPAGGMHQCWQ
jgi:hypothetical protein